MFLIIAPQDFQGFLDIQLLSCVGEGTFDQIQLPVADIAFGLINTYRRQ